MTVVSQLTAPVLPKPVCVPLFVIVAPEATVIFPPEATLIFEPQGILKVSPLSPNVVVPKLVHEQIYLLKLVPYYYYT